MTQGEITNKVREIKELEQLIKEAQAEADALRDEIKMQMVRDGKEEITAGVFTVRYQDVISRRFDSTAFRKVHPDMYEKFKKETSSKRFTIN